VETRLLIEKTLGAPYLPTVTLARRAGTGTGIGTDLHR